jgi:DNA repair protein RAD50
VEKERLEGLVREKRHADKLKNSLADLNADISAKQVEYEDTLKRHREITLSNKRFLDQATHFREIYVKAENAQRQKERLEENLREALSSVIEVEGMYDFFLETVI